MRRELMMRDGEVEPIEGVVIISENLAARQNVKIISQVGLTARLPLKYVKVYHYPSTTFLYLRLLLTEIILFVLSYNSHSVSYFVEYYICCLCVPR